MQIYPDMVEDPDTQTQTVLYGAKTGYFRKDLIVFYNFNPLRYVAHLHFIYHFILPAATTDARATILTHTGLPIYSCC